MRRPKRRQTSLVKQREGSANWYCNFSVGGTRFRECLGTDDKDEAERRASKIRYDSLEGQRTKAKREMTLTEAFARYWTEGGKDQPSADITKRCSRYWEAALGKEILLSEITKDDLLRYRTDARYKRVFDPNNGKEIVIGPRANATINRELHFLGRILRRAEDWDVNASRINIQRLVLPEPDKRQHILTQDEEKRLFGTLRQDFHPLVRFALKTGLRVSNVITLTWDQIDRDARQFHVKVKSRKVGGRLHYLPLDEELETILDGEVGRDPKYVFTWEARTDRPGGIVAGERYPFALRPSWRAAWNNALKAAGLRSGNRAPHDFRFHDLRHTAATRLLRKTHNLAVVKRMLGHENIATTLRYANTDVEDVRKAWE